MARQVIDIRKELVNRIGNVYPISSNKVGDAPGVSTICSAVMTTYQQTYLMMKTITGPARALQNRIIEGFDNISHDTLKTINKELNGLMANIPKIVLPKTMDPAAAGMTSLFKESCLDFKSFLPEALNIQIDEMVAAAKESIAETLDLDSSDEMFMNKSKMSILDMIYETEQTIKGFMTLPMDMFNQVSEQTKMYKDAAINEVFGSAAAFISEPIMEYELMMFEFGVVDAINKLRKIERCLMKPSFCGKKKKDLVGPTVAGEPAKDLLSVELTKAFNIDGSGRLRLTRILTSDASKLKTMLNIKRKLVSFSSQ